MQDRIPSRISAYTCSFHDEHDHRGRHAREKLRHLMRDRLGFSSLISLLMTLAGSYRSGRQDSVRRAWIAHAARYGRRGAIFCASAPRVSLSLDPANFTNGVQNPYFPLLRGMTWVYRQDTRDGVELATVEVTLDPKIITDFGVTTFVVTDRVYL